MVSGREKTGPKFYFLHDLCLRDCKSQLTYVDAVSTCFLPALSTTGMGPVARKLPTYLSSDPVWNRSIRKLSSKYTRQFLQQTYSTHPHSDCTTHGLNLSSVVASH